VRPRYLGWEGERFFQKTEEIEGRILSLDQKNNFDLSALAMLETQKRLVGRVSRKYEDFSFGEPHVLHGDYQEGNIFFDENDNVRWTFDLEIANLAPRIFEVMRSMEIICFNGYFDESSFVRAETFLRAYHSVYPLEKSVLAAGVEAWYYNQAHTTWVLEEYYLKGNARVAEFVEKYMRFFEYCSGNLDAYTERIVGFIGREKRSAKYN
jgi:aminoglycoside phosphotransferase (APT) family kinase protein